jgi:hypothetical protein
MNATPSSRPTETASTVAFVAAGLFTLRFVFFFLPYLHFLPSGFTGLVQDGTLGGAILGNAEHLVLFPIIAALPAPRWAKQAGYGWLVVDMATDICKRYLPRFILPYAMEDTSPRYSRWHVPPGKRPKQHVLLACCTHLTLASFPTFLMDRFFSLFLQRSSSPSGWSWLGVS